jgi:hypothetical protein
MARSLTLEIPDDVYEPLRCQAKKSGRTPEDIATEWLAATIRRMAEDPLLQLAGTIESDITDVADRHDYYIGEQLLKELRADADA